MSASLHPESGGWPTAFAAFCPQCGRPNTDGKGFCPQCGWNLSWDRVNLPPGTAPTAGPPAPPPQGAPPPWVYFPPTAATVPVRHADAVSIFSETFRAWGRDVFAYLGLYVLAGLLTASVNVAAFWFLLGVPWPTTEALANLPASLGPNFVMIYALLLIAGALVGAVVTAWFTAVVTYFAVTKRRGHPVPWSEAVRTGTRRFPSVLGGTLLLNGLLGIFTGLDSAVSLSSLQNPFSSAILAAECGVFLILGLWLFLWISLLLYAPAAVMEGVGALESLRRSWTLTRGRRLSLFGALLLLGLVALVVEVPAVFVPALLGNPVASFAGAVVTTTIIGAWEVLIAAVAYELIGEEVRQHQAWQAYVRPAGQPP